MKIVETDLNETEKENYHPNIQKLDLNCLTNETRCYFLTHTSTGWFLEFSCKSYFEISKYEKKVINGVKIYRTVKVFEDLSWESSYAGRRNPSSLFCVTPSIIGNFNDLLNIIHVIEHTKICCGVSNPDFEVLSSNASDVHGQLIGCQEECVLLDSQGIKKQTLQIHRAVKCMFYIISTQTSSNRCSYCSVLRRNLSVQLVRFNKKSSSMESNTSSVGPDKSRTNKRFLSEYEKTEKENYEKRRRINAEKRERYWRFKSVQEKNMRNMNQQNNEDLLTMFKYVDKGTGEDGEDLMFPDNAKMSLFWSMQRDAVSNAEKRTSIRWHPLHQVETSTCLST